MISLDAIYDQFFRSQVRLSHQIQLAFVGYEQRSPEAFSQQPSGIARSFYSEVEQTNPLTSAGKFRQAFFFSGYIRTVSGS
jgi:hypothetical protein